MEIKKQKDIIEELMDMRKNGLPEGDRQGFAIVDENLRLVPGGCTDLIGYPFHGKSLFMKEWVVNMAVNAKWRWLLHMPDDGDDKHVLSDLIWILSGKTFDKQYKNFITERELQTYATALLSAIDFISSDYAIPPEVAFEMAEKGKYNGLGLDSWNRLGHKGSIKDPDYVGTTLSLRNRVMMRSGCHCLMTMHPKTPLLNELSNGNVKPPTVYNMYGGSEVNNNGKNIIVIYKELKHEYKAPYDIIVSKVKPKQCGTLGQFQLKYDWAVHRFYSEDFSGNREYAGTEPQEKKDELPF